MHLSEGKLFGVVEKLEVVQEAFADLWRHQLCEC